MEKLSSTAEQLLERGLNLYRENRRAEAIEQWEELLRVDPNNALAKEYLESTRTQESFGTPALRVVPDLEPVNQELASRRARELVLSLVKAHRFEEALQSLYHAHQAAPQDAAISRSIAVVKQRLLREYQAELGSLDGVPYRNMQITPRQGLLLESNEEALLLLVDGLLSFGDILQSSSRGTLLSSKALAGLLKKELIAVKHPSEPREEPASAPTSSDSTITAMVSQLPPAIALSGTTAIEAPIPEFKALLASAVKELFSGRLVEARRLLDEAQSICPDDPISKRNLMSLLARIERGSS
jgi:tetratricopeptide (TPR) repeat protein